MTFPSKNVANAVPDFNGYVFLTRFDQRASLVEQGWRGGASRWREICRRRSGSAEQSYGHELSALGATLSRMWVRYQVAPSRTGRVCRSHFHCLHSNPIQTANMPTDQPAEFEHQLVALRSYLMRFARLQLRNDAWAEDAVSETLLAALAKPLAFEARSQLKTWLVGILKHKIIDAMRQRQREVVLECGSGDDSTDPLEHMAFKRDGHFAEKPADWGNPEQDLNSRQFFVILEACTDKLPAVQGRLFLMREWLELSSDDICKELGLTPTNLYVQLHRARLRLRECLELNWFAAR